ncbi:hypothetical protein KC345_g10469 [Hortaea werneckii]|nr:hypothetical protein KC345_g10469 [Hortaea werneckii]
MLRGTGLRAQAAKYDYTYMEHAPYEILSSHVMPFSDIIRLKRLEDVLEKYWNSHRLDHSVKYLIRHVFPSPFDFFQEFGDYWEARGWQKIGHQLEDLFTRLHDFLTDRGTASMEIITGLMKLDYFLGHKYKPRKIWWDDVLDKSEWAKYLKQIAEQPERISAKLAEAGLSERELQKFIVLDVLPFRLEPVLDSLSGLRFDGLVATEVEAVGNADGSADSIVSGAGAAAETTGSLADSKELRAAVATADPGESAAIAGDGSGGGVVAAAQAVPAASAPAAASASAAAVLLAQAAALHSDVAVGEGNAPALTDPHPGSGDGSTLLIVLYQQDESQRAQYYALPV